ncbi:hypothetical protein [Deinococcus rufus]|uniref:Transcriptional regulator n=1 Tax=Deinococcus rufus TaxID=2136097 RepID=A0ABV7Z8V9_9DEIO
MSSRSEDWTPLPLSMAHHVLTELGPAPGPLSRRSSDALHQATSQLRRAGYIERVVVAGRRSPQWRRTPAGDAALARSGTGLARNPARVLLLGAAPRPIRVLMAAYRSSGHPPHATHWLYAVLAQLERAGLAVRAGEPATWRRTPAGEQACAAARVRLGLPPT